MGNGDGGQHDRGRGDAMMSHREDAHEPLPGGAGEGGEPTGAGAPDASRHERSTRGFRAPERPPLPKPERLNRNALTIAAVVMGVLVLAAVVFVEPNRPERGEPAAARPPEPTTPTFLDQPTRPPGSGADSAGERSPLAEALDSAMGTPPTSLGTAPSGPYAGAHASAGDAGVTYTVPLLDAERPATVRARDRRADAYQAALDAPMVASAVAEARGAGRGYAGSVPGGLASPSDASGGGASVPGVTRAVTDRADGRGATLSGATWGRHQAFMADVARGAPTTIRTSVEPAPGPYSVQAGTVIPAVLVTEINSDLPGNVLAQIARDVYDSRTQQILLIPRGSRLLGRYEHQLAVGQDRLLVAWTRVIFPDGRSVMLPGLETKDHAGAGGVRDQVDRHTRQVFGTTALLSLVGAAVQLSQPNGGYGAFGAYPSPGQVAAGAVGQQLAQVATQMLQRNLDVQPTIRIRQGMPFNVFLNADLTFPGPYAAEP